MTTTNFKSRVNDLLVTHPYHCTVDMYRYSLIELVHWLTEEQGVSRGDFEHYTYSYRNRARLVMCFRHSSVATVFTLRWV